jgi:hypothetical protein
MANPFFSGRIPPGLADKIDAHLLATGETRSELLVRLLRAEVGDNKFDNTTDNVGDNTLADLIARVEQLERTVNNKADNKPDRVIDNKSDNDRVDRSDWVDLSTVAAALGVLPKSISGAMSKRGRDIGNDTSELEIAGKTIHKQGSGLKALYQVL